MAKRNAPAAQTPLTLSEAIALARELHPDPKWSGTEADRDRLAEVERQRRHVVEQHGYTYLAYLRATVPRPKGSDPWGLA